MKSEKEIREKIDELFSKLESVENRCFVISGAGAAEAIKCNIDALLWVIGDESGRKI